MVTIRQFIAALSSVWKRPEKAAEKLVRQGDDRLQNGDRFGAAIAYQEAYGELIRSADPGLMAFAYSIVVKLIGLYRELGDGAEVDFWSTREIELKKELFGPGEPRE